MEGQRTAAFLLLVLAMGSFQAAEAVNELKLDQALLNVQNHLSDNISLYYVSDYCYQCLYQSLVSLEPRSASGTANASVVVSTRFTLTLQVFAGTNTTTPLCRWSELFGEHGQYTVSVRSVPSEHNDSAISCSLSVDKDPVNGYIPLLVAAVVFLCATALYFLGIYTCKLRCTKNCLKAVTFKKHTSRIDAGPAADGSIADDKPKSRRLLSLDTFRGFALTVMVFVNYGGGGYWFFEHAPWNGLTIADLVMPWFVFMIGTSVALAFIALLKRGVTRLQLLRKITWRTIVLMVIGLFFLNYGPADGPLSWSWARIPGVLQRLGFTYFTIALMQTCFGKKIQDCKTVAWWAPVRDVVLYWPEWIVIGLLETLWLSLTFLLSVPGCLTGYLGPGGIGDQGRYPTCTGGAAAYIDKWLLGENHIFGHPTCKELYKTTVPFDPEGVLGTINSVLMAFFGLQAGKIILLYRKQPYSILKRFVVWAVLLGILSAILTKCSRDEGFIPVNKNLWSLSFVTTMSCFSFLVLGVMFYVIDVKHWWGGQPFIFPGMNSIFVYVGHSLLGSYFPFNWEMKSSDSHAEPLAQDLLGTSIWVLVAYFLFRQKFFLKI
ncbi:heparan-alpha-glucosaminide N-acetyltransferase-like isoform X1 [Pleurodeles waltl]